MIRCFDNTIECDLEGGYKSDSSFDGQIRINECEIPDGNYTLSGCIPNQVGDGLTNVQLRHAVDLWTNEDTRQTAIDQFGDINTWEI